MKTIRVQRASGDVEVPVRGLGPAQVPDGDGGGYGRLLENPVFWDGHVKSKARDRLLSWTLPGDVQGVRDKVEVVLAEGVPDQRRRMLRNQDVGMLDDVWVDAIAAGEHVDRPFARWTRRARKECRVKILLDAATHCGMPPTILTSRICVAAGLAGALEGLGYEAEVLAADLMASIHDGSRYNPLPRRPRDPARRPLSVQLQVLKPEGEPLVDSGFSHYSDTGFRRLINCWLMGSNGMSTHLTDREWRDLAGDADLYVLLTCRSKFNHQGLPSGIRPGVHGPDSVTLRVESMNDVDRAVQDLSEHLGVALQT